MFTAEEYSAAVDELIPRLMNIRDFLDRSATQPALENICSLLRVGRVEALYFQTPAHEAINNSKSAVMYDCGSADEDPEKTVRMREPVENGAVAHFLFYPIKDGEAWSPEEKAKLNILQKLIFSYNGRSNLLVAANRYMYSDLALDMPNLPYIMRKLGELMSKGTVGDYTLAYFNIRRFSVVNNQIGRDEGTEIMKRYAHGLMEKLSGEECVGRIGGDNFLVLFLKSHLEDVSVYLSGVRIKSEHRRAEFLISAYVGFYMIDPSECRRPADIMDRAVIAMNIAKKGSGSPFVFYNSDIDANVKNAKQIEDMVPDALKKGEFLVYYQPKVSIKDYTLTGAEALCRWKHGGEMIQPFRFIPVLERSKLICELDFYMLDHVCRDIRRWLDEGKKVVKVSVNLSRVHLGDANLLDDIIGIVDRYNVPHRYIEIELTETTTDADYGELKRVVSGLREAGISTSVDDFGIGYSSLSLIRELPWNVLKIDKSFLPDGSENDEQRLTMLKHVISMSNELGLECIVEGVESMEQVMILKENGCYLAQGFYFDRPLPTEAFEEVLEQQR